MKVPLLDLTGQYRRMQAEVDAAVARVFASQYFILGPEVQQFEREIAEYCGCAQACGVTSGTDALLLSMMAEGIGPGDEVILPSYTFFATAGSVCRLGARPVFVDIDPRSFNLIPEQVEAAVTPQTRAIMPVHLYGRMAEMDPLLDLARRRQIVVIEDACQAIGAELRGRRAGSIGDYGCFSFFPSKNLGGAGDGGMITVQDPAKAERLAILRNHGMNPKYHHSLIGGNFRLDALQAAVLRVKLPHLESWTEARRANALRYESLLAQAGLAAPADDGDPAIPVDNGPFPIVLPQGFSSADSRHVANQYVIRLRRRDEARAFLAQRDIGTEIYYPVPLHRQECFAHLGYTEGSLPESERAARETLALPVFPELTNEQADYIVRSLAEFYA
jgi:dTDP-4-amino-4,6-dideoxygalactose transaminase